MTSIPPPPMLYLEDLHIGQRFISGETFKITPEAVTEFAAQYDPQPFHLDDTAAHDTLFGRLAASGWHTAAITMRLLVTGGVPIAGGLIGAGCEVMWPRPTYPGDILRVESQVLNIKPSKSKPDRGIVVLHTETRNQHNEMVQVMDVKIVVPARGRTTPA